ncbi:MAG: hypothetical protein WC479_00620 [Candidatus Izemoplasmatales bacterium]
MKFTIRLKGGAGSGHHGHRGIPGHHGGSLPRDGQASAAPKFAGRQLERSEVTYEYNVSNGNYKLPKGIKVWIKTGTQRSGVWYGAAQVLDNTYDVVTTKSGDILCVIPGGNFMIRKGQNVAEKVRFFEPTHAMLRDDMGRLVPKNLTKVDKNFDVYYNS